MFKYIKIVVLVLVCSFIGQVAGFSEYYEYAGKWVKLNGPSSWEVIGVGLDEVACDKIKAASLYGDSDYFILISNQYDIFRVVNGEHAMVQTIDFDNKRAKVMVFKSLYERESGWVPLEWIKGNEYRPSIKDVAKNNYTSSGLRNFYQQGLVSD